MFRPDTNPIQRIFFQEFNSDLATLVNRFNESNYNCVKEISLTDEICAASDKIFEACKELDSTNPQLAVETANHFFNQFTQLWQHYLYYGRVGLSVQLWLRAITLAWTWEKNNRYQIHKGTPYFFLAETELYTQDFDAAFVMLHSAYEQDKIYAGKIGADPKKLPAYLTLSLDPTIMENHAYPLLRIALAELEKYLQIYNQQYPKNKKMSFSDFQNKFLKKTTLEDVGFFFAYLLNKLVAIKGRMADVHLQQNEFSKIYLQNLIFDFCLVVDKVAHEKTNENYISGSVEKLMARYNVQNITGNPTIYADIGFCDDSTFPSAIQKCLSKTYAYNNQNIPQEVLDSVLVWGLRNKGGHQIKAEKILVEKQEEIIQHVFNALFLWIDY